MALKGDQPKPAPGFVLAKELDPAMENQLISGSSLELSGGNEHTQLKLAEVLLNGGPSLEARQQAAEIHKVAAFDEFLNEVPQGLRKGDVIAFQSLAAHKLRIGGTQYLLVPYDQINAVIGELE